MREFRGKHIHIFPQNKHLNGLWVYGYLCDENYINTVMVDEYGGKFTAEMLVDPKTVGQYIGMTDITKWEELSEDERREFLSGWNFEEDRQNVKEDWKGKKIFEGDVLNVVYSDQTGECHCDKGVVVKSIYEFRIMERLSWAHEFKVTGNIFDNPELV